LRKMPRHPPASAKRAPRAHAPAPAPAAAPHSSRAPGRLALERILYQPRGTDGGRHVNIGKTGYGKSYLTLALLEELRRGRCKWIFTLDDKDANQTAYPGGEYVNVAAFRERPPQAAEGVALERRVVFRGDKYAGLDCTAEEVAQLAKDMDQSGIPVCVNFDELKRAAQTKNGQAWTAPTVPWLLTESRSLGGWFIGSGTSAKRFPDEALNEASSIAVFRQKARAAHYIVDVLELDDQVAEQIQRLEVGDFVLLTEEEDWDGRIYRL
jgi:hypothetical protein